MKQELGQDFANKKKPMKQNNIPCDKNIHNLIGRLKCTTLWR